MLLEDIKSRIHTAQVKAALSVNRELTDLYWKISKSEIEHLTKGGYNSLSGF
jgi:hypothetical protein